MKKPLIVLTGPTAAGKTHLSIALAKAVNGEIISADSMQVYKYMDIGSAKIRPEEMQGVKHYLVDELLPQEEFHIVKFQQMAKAAMEEIYAKGKIPVLVGGTGFYIQAITKDIDFTQAEQEDGYRQELEQLAAEKGNEYLHQMLLDVDPVSAGEIHANNVKRVIRALEFYATLFILTCYIKFYIICILAFYFFPHFFYFLHIIYLHCWCFIIFNFFIK